jgi:protease PrsW
MKCRQRKGHCTFMVVPILVAIGVPLLFLYVIWALEIYAISRLQVIISAIVWGVLTFVIAYQVHSALVANGLASYTQITLLVAPVLEELLKAALIFWLAAYLHLRYAVDGAAYGFAIGTGFAVAENLLYIHATPSYALDIAVARVLSTSLVHAFDTAVLGALAGGTVYMGARSRLPRLLGGLILVMCAHGLFNFLANRIEGLPLILIGVLFGLGGMTLIIGVIGWSLRAERQWIARGLADRRNIDRPSGRTVPTWYAST